ncbi:MAG: response regulator [Pseudomonadota bacterium]
MTEIAITVLLIDDEEEFTSTLAERLELRGYETRTANNGETGISMMSNTRFSIAVLDLKMPGLNGLDTLRRMKSINPDMPVILLTGHGSTREGMEGMRLGAYDYLMKPLDIDNLIVKIQGAMSAPGKR